MTKILENGQLEWTFEELDFEGAREIIKEEIELLMNANEIFLMNQSEHTTKEYQFWYYDRLISSNNRDIKRLIKVMLYCERLMRGQLYV